MVELKMPLNLTSLPILALVMEAPWGVNLGDYAPYVRQSSRVGRYQWIVSKLFNHRNDFIRTQDVEFDLEGKLAAIDCPVLLLHSQDDEIVPYGLGKRLYDDAVSGGKRDIRLVTVGAGVFAGPYHHTPTWSPGVMALIVKFLEQKLDDE